MAGAAQTAIATPRTSRAAFAVSRETLDQLADLRGPAAGSGRRRSTWSRRARSTTSGIAISPTPPSSCALAPADAKRWVDLGSGAGFPGLVLAILLAERGRAHASTLVESDARKAAFLRRGGAATGVPVDILRPESKKPRLRAKLGRVDVVTARALGAACRGCSSLSAPLFSADDGRAVS